jgi:hypothetical protein
MSRTLRLISLLVAAALVLILNPNRTLGLWLAVIITTAAAIALVESGIPIPAEYARARRRLLFFTFASLIAAPFLVAVGSSYAIGDAVRLTALASGFPVAFLAIGFGLRRLAG